MSESLDSQIVIDTTESFFPDGELSLKRVGRKRLINRENYLESVKKVLSTSDKEVGEELGVDRTNVWRFRKKFPEVYEEAKKILSEIEDLTFTKKIKRWNNFFVCI